MTVRPSRYFPRWLSLHWTKIPPCATDKSPLSGAPAMLRLEHVAMSYGPGREVLHDIDLPLRINGGDDAQIGAVVAEMMGWLGLAELRDAAPRDLSMAQRQLVAVARAVIARPGLLLCDEPTSHVDDKLARRVMHLLAQLCKLGSTVVLSTHDDDLVDRYPHPILRMCHGRLSRPAAAAATMAAAD